jgi:hypothetical protein
MAPAAIVSAIVGAIVSAAPAIDIGADAFGERVDGVVGVMDAACFERFEEGGMGTGVRTRVPVARGARVLSVTGKAVPAHIYGMRGLINKSRRPDGDHSSAFDELDLPLGANGRAIVISPGSADLWRYVNHRCGGTNLEPGDEDLDDGTVGSFLFATVDIAAGAPLSWNYNALTNDPLEPRQKCLCAHPLCAGFLTRLMPRARRVDGTDLERIGCLVAAQTMELTNEDRLRLRELRLTGDGDATPGWILKFMALAVDRLLGVPHGFRFDSVRASPDTSWGLRVLRDAAQATAFVADRMSQSGAQLPLPLEVSGPVDGWVEFRVVENPRVRVSSGGHEFCFPARFLACICFLYANPHNSLTPEASLRAMFNTCAKKSGGRLVKVPHAAYRFRLAVGVVGGDAPAAAADGGGIGGDAAVAGRKRRRE